MVSQPTAEDRLMDRRSVLRTGAAMAAAGPALLHGAHAEAQPRPSGASPMTIIDAQVHAYAANTSERSWPSVPNWPPSPATRWWRRWRVVYTGEEQRITVWNRTHHSLGADIAGSGPGFDA